LIEKLQGRDFRAVQEFLKNPLLTSLLYRSFEYKQNLPIKKHVFYRQVFDALFDWHDATKDGYNTREKKSKLDIDSFHRVLRVLGFISTIQGKLEGEADIVLEWIRQARGVCVNTNFSESDFLEDLIRAVPIFVRDGLYYRWSHKSLAEYFAAQYICTEGKQQHERILGDLLDSGKLDRFSNMLDQVYDLDIAAFRKCLILPMAKEFKKYWAKAYKDVDPRIPSELVTLRKSCTFGGMFLLGGKTQIGSGWGALKKSLEPFAREQWGVARTIEDLPIQMRLPHRSESNVDLYVIIPGRFSVILDILEAKKDEIVRNRTMVDVSKYKSRVRVRVLKRWLEVTDERKNPVNSASNFAPTTALLIQSGATIVDADRLLRFEESLVESSNLSSLTTRLLESLKTADVP
jgi:hypothetical protein